MSSAHPSNATLAVLFIVALGIAALGVRRKRSSSLSLPPGPKGLPIIGSALDTAGGYQWLAYEKWGREYGSDVIHVWMFNTSVVVLNSMKAANDLFEKKSSIYSDRHAIEQLTMFHELVGWDWNLAFMPYGERWREHRRLFHQYFQPSVVPRYRPKLATETQKFISRLHRSPEDWLRHVRHLTGAIIIGVTYGLDVKQENDPNVLLAEKAIYSMAMTGVAGTYLVDWIPQLKYLPTWVPGASFIKQAAAWREDVVLMSKVPFDDVKKQLKEGKASPSVVASLLSTLDGDDAERELIFQNTAGTAYTGGADTTVSALGTFILAMTTHPEIQARAQAELDAVVGPDRLPSYDDMPRLPYFAAMMKEVLRWRPVTPLAASHKVMEEDVYNGMRIPAGSIVIGNAWAILHDPQHYPNPNSFQPERFLNKERTALRKDVMDPEDAAFGFGRRKCPGRYLAMDSLWLAMAYLLQVFRIEPPAGSAPGGDYTTGLLSYPKPFDVSFTPRHEDARRLVESLELSA